MNKVMIALLAGFAAGILLAPDKGSVTRKKISDGIDDLANNLSDLAERFAPEETKTTDTPIVAKMSAAV